MQKIHKKNQFHLIQIFKGMHYLCKNSDLCVPATVPKDIE